MSRPTVALATAATWPDLDADGPALTAALSAAGVAADVCVWDDPSVDWARYDLVVVRSTWDYADRLDDFLAWAASVPRLANPADVLRWNTDKRYLRDLERAGLPVVPTTFLAPGEDLEVPAGEYVVKPSVSAGAADTARFGAGEPAGAHALVARIAAAGKHVMVQPYVAAVDEAGETSVLVFGGRVSHAIRKARVLEPGAPPRSTPPGLEVISRRSASPAEVDLAVAAADAVPALVSGRAPGTGGPPLLYARVDVVPGPDGPLLLELEVSEPSLFLGFAPGSAERFAAAVVERLAASG